MYMYIYIYKIYICIYVCICICICICIYTYGFAVTDSPGHMMYDLQNVHELPKQSHDYDNQESILLL